MGRILAIDYGKRRTGLAVTDPLKLIANGLTTVSGSELLPWLDAYLKKEQVERLVVGLPRQMDGKPSAAMPDIEKFVAAFSRRHPEVPVSYHDERFTSVLAHRALLDGGLHRMDRRNKPLVDTVSAVIILQGYLEGERIRLERENPGA